MPTEDEIKSSQISQLVKLADMMETCDYGDANWREYNREYKKIAKALYPEMYPPKIRKPSQALIRTFTPCTCGDKGFKYQHNGLRVNPKVQLQCPTCGRESGWCATNNQMRDHWNATFIKKDQLEIKLE